MRTSFTLMALALLAAACTDTLEPMGTGAPSPAFSTSAAGGSVYTMSNAVAGNAVLAFHRATDGTLTFDASYPTGGTGNNASRTPSCIP